MNVNKENNLILDNEQIKDWLTKYQNINDDKIKNQIKNLIVHYYIPLVKKIAYGLARRQSDPIEDIIQVGCVGLIKSIEQFDGNFGASFKTYATYRITGEIRHYLRDKASIIRAPRELLELSFRMNNLIEELKTKLGRFPTELEIANELELSVKRVNEVFEVDRRKQTMSLDQIINVSENEQTLADKLIDNKYQEYQNFQEEKMILMEAVNSLPAQLKEVIELSFFEDLNQNEIAKKIGVSQMQVSRRIKKATNELFNTITRREQLDN